MSLDDLQADRRRVTDGTARARRLGHALAAGYVLPQERTLADRLALVAEVAGLVGFADAAGGVSGTWARLFEQEPAVVMARLLAVAPEARRAGFVAALEGDPAAAARELHGFARQVADWLARAAGRDAFAAQIGVIEGRTALTGMVQALAGTDDPRPGALAALVLGGEAAGDALDRARGAREALVQAYDQLLNIVAALRPAVLRAFEARLASRTLDPALGLVLADLRLLGVVEAEANRFVERHWRFYYHDVLGQSARAAVPESVLLRFAAGALPVLVREGAEVVAKTAGAAESQRYRLLEGLRVAPVRVAEIRTLRFHRSPLISPQAEMGFVTGIGLAALRPEGGDGGQALFAPAGAGSAAMGLSVASPMLMLAEGRRQVAVRLCLARRQEAGDGGPVGGEAAVVRGDPALVAAFGLGSAGEAVAVVEGWVGTLPEAAGTARERVYQACLTGGGDAGAGAGDLRADRRRDAGRGRAVAGGRLSGAAAGAGRGSARGGCGGGGGRGADRTAAGGGVPAAVA